jgi:hypothetical protein
MWRSNVLKTMLKERKIELHRQIAQAMEFDKGLMIRRNDISRLLTLYDHWKLCGEFRKAAPLALTVGSKLHEWDLQAQSAELYLDTLELCYESVQPVDKNLRVTKGKCDLPILLDEIQPSLTLFLTQKTGSKWLQTQTYLTLSSAFIFVSLKTNDRWACWIVLP